MQIIGKTFDEERALYHQQDTLIHGCSFAGPADGESALKEARNVVVQNCEFFSAILSGMSVLLHFRNVA